MVKDERDFHASAFLLGPDNTTVLVRDLRHQYPLWKFPGGKKQLIKVKRFSKRMRGETPFETLWREVLEETGLIIRKRQTQYLTTRDKGNHNKHYYLSQLQSFKKLVPLSKEYEEAKVFPANDLLWMPDFHPNYMEIYCSHIQPLLLEAA